MPLGYVEFERSVGGEGVLARIARTKPQRAAFLDGAQILSLAIDSTKGSQQQAYDYDLDGESKSIDPQTFLIEQGVRLKGDFTTPHILAVQGCVEGVITAPAFWVGPSGVVNGKFVANGARVSDRLVERIEVRFWTVARKFMCRFALALLCGGALSAIPVPNMANENTHDRVQGGRWVVASMYWQDKLVSTGKKFDPIGWHAAHKTLPIGTAIRVTNPKNYRSINVTINDRGPYVEGRELDLSLGAGALLGFQGLGFVYMEVLSIPSTDKMQRPIVEELFLSSKSSQPSTSVAKIGEHK
jgi:hypothetical protein